jgi:hypothetical protein
MTPDRKTRVGGALARLVQEAGPDSSARLQQKFDRAAVALDQCKKEVSCYEAILDDPIASSQPSSSFKAIKATWMSVIYGAVEANATRAELLKRVEHTADATVRAALVAAADELARRLP